jgi:nicotinamide mononucleotide (NMN) deamidase PncC
MHTTHDRCGSVGGGDLDTTVLALAELMARRRGARRIGCAEQATAGLLARCLSTVARGDDWFAGGLVVPHEADLRRVLGVRAQHVVSEGAAVQMALGVSHLLGTAAAVATTGRTDEGSPAPDRTQGTVAVGWVVDGTWGGVVLTLPGSDHEVELRTVRTALTSLSRAMAEADDRLGGGHLAAG